MRPRRSRCANERWTADADIQQGVGASAGAGEFHHRDHTVGLPGAQGRRPVPAMLRGDIDAENQIASADTVARSFHPENAKD